MDDEVHDTSQQRSGFQIELQRRLASRHGGGRNAAFRFNFGYPRPLGHWVPRVGHGTSGAATVLRPHGFQELEGLRRRTPLLVALAGRHSEKGGETGMTRGEYARDLLQICQLPATLVSFPRPMSFAQATSSATETHQKGMMFNIAGWSETGDESAFSDVHTYVVLLFSTSAEGNTVRDNGIHD